MMVINIHIESNDLSPFSSPPLVALLRWSDCLVVTCRPATGQLRMHTCRAFVCMLPMLRVTVLANCDSARRHDRPAVGAACTGERRRRQQHTS